MEREISELIEIGRELHSRGWLPASGGNLSARLEDKEGKREGMVGKEEKEDSSERQWEGSGV